MTAGPQLRWRETGDAEREWAPLLPAPADNSGFHETRRYQISKPFLGAVLFVDDEPLAADPADSTSWIWEPGFYAGPVTCELTDSSGEPRALFRLDVAPDARKLGRDEFGAMIRELLELDPALVIGNEPATTITGELGESEDPWVAFARLRLYGPAAAAAIEAIRARPRMALRMRRELAPLRNTRRVDRQTAVALRQSPAALKAIVNGDCDAGGAERLDVPRIEETLDSAANRAILALIQSLLRRTREVFALLDAKVRDEQESQTETGLANRWPRRRKALESIADRLTRLRRQSPWTEVTRAELSAAGLNAVAADPVYSRAWSLGWRALRRGMESGEAGDPMWISPTWEIYERWCFVRLARLLREFLPNWQWRRDDRAWTANDGGRRIRLELQPTFRAGPTYREWRWSLSKQREPDLLLTVEKGESISFLVLDAKYRATRTNVLDAMESAHIYRDSLRIGEERAAAALLLIPAGGGAKWLEEVPFQMAHRVGVHVFNQGAEVALPALVTEFLAENLGSK